MKEVLGTLKITVTYDPVTKDLDAHHETELAPGLNEMQNAMSDADKMFAAQLRRDACQKAGDFFLFVRDPDTPLTTE